MKWFPVHKSFPFSGFLYVLLPFLPSCIENTFSYLFFFLADDLLPPSEESSPSTSFTPSLADIPFDDPNAVRLELEHVEKRMKEKDSYLHALQKSIRVCETQLADTLQKLTALRELTFNMVESLEQKEEDLEREIQAEEERNRRLQERLVKGQLAHEGTLARFYKRIRQLDSSQVHAEELRQKLSKFSMDLATAKSRIGARSPSFIALLQPASPSISAPSSPVHSLTAEDTSTPLRHKRTRSYDSIVT